MGYVKLDDAFLDHPKFLEAGPLAGYLALCAIAWSNRNRTNGFIPTAQVKRLASFDELEVIDDGVPVLGEANPWRMAEDLVLAGLWEKVERGYEIHDYLEWQSSAEHIQQVSTARAEAGRKGAEARWNGTARAEQPPSDGNSHSNLNGNADSKPMADECQKEEVRTNGKTPKPSELGAAASRLFAYWQTTCGHPTSRLTRDRRSKIEARIREGYSEQQIQQAIDGAARAAFVNEAGKRFDDLELICRSGSKLEDFIGRTGTATNAPKTSVDIAREWQGA